MANPNRVFNYKVQRRIVGAIALLLGPVTSWLAGRSLPSISDSYWTDANSVFVGALCVVAAFLAGYSGQGESRDREYWLAKVTGVLALLVALFPTSGPADVCGESASQVSCVPPEWTSQIASWFGVAPTNIHYFAAVLLFAGLTYMMWIFSSRARTKGYPARANFYAGFCIMMLMGLLAGLASWLMQLGQKDLVYWIELWILSWFGIGWLLAGWYTDHN